MTLAGRDILYLSGVDWEQMWQAPQEIAVRLAAMGNRVLYVQNTGIRAPARADQGRVLRRVAGLARSGVLGGTRPVARGVWLLPPLALPPFGSPVQRLFNQVVLGTQVRAAMARLRFRPSLVWTYLPTDTTRDLVNLVRGPDTAVVYWCGADMRERVNDVARLVESERALVEESAVVFTNCAPLAARFAPWNPEVHVSSPGVDISLFEGSAGAPEPEAVRPLARPRIGYVGGLHKELDLDLAIALAEARPAWSWVYVGEIYEDVARLRALPNVHLLGPRPHHEIPAFVEAFDACIVPYRRSRYGATVVPTKINEYLALGKPIVSTELPMVQRMYDRDIVRTAPSVAEFLVALDAALAEGADPERISNRKRVAAEADWRIRVDEMVAAIERAR